MKKRKSQYFLVSRMDALSFSGTICFKVTFIPRAMYRIFMQRSSPWVNLLAFAQLGYESYQSVGSISIFLFFAKNGLLKQLKLDMLENICQNLE